MTASSTKQDDIPTRRPSGTPDANTTVLVIDDEARLADTIRLLLAPEHEVTLTYNVEEANAHLAGGASPDVILCDLTLPGKSGADFFAELQATRPDLVERIAFMTGGPSVESIARFLRQAGRPFLEKPFQAADLQAVVRSLLAHRGL